MDRYILTVRVMFTTIEDAQRALCDIEADHRWADNQTGYEAYIQEV